MIKTLLWPAYSLLESPLCYGLTQRIAAPTVAVNSHFLKTRVQTLLRREHRILDLGCGIGGYHKDMSGAHYVGVDINPEYIQQAAATLPGEFHVMDAAKLTFDPGSFDHVVSIATTHHLSDAEISSMLSSILTLLRPGGKAHIIDAILPENKLNIFKQVWFRLDRGNHVRTRAQLLSAIGAVCEPEMTEVRRESVLHDVLYVRIGAPGGSRTEA